MRRLIQAFCLVFLFYGFTLAGTDSTVSAVADSAVASTKYLHISTNPSHVDVYVNNIKPKHYKEPDYKMPGFIPVPAGESSIMVSIFRPEYADTTINVTLSQKDTSFLIVALRPNYDDKKTDEQYMRMALNEAMDAFEADEVPVGAVVVLNGQVIARGHNLTETLHDVTAHAEMIAITAGSGALGAKYLKGCTLYVTLEP